MRALLRVLRTGAPFTVVFATGLLVGYLLREWSLPDRDTRPEFRSPPGEYLYLDEDRVLAYLGQIYGGLKERSTTWNAEMVGGRLEANAGP